MTLYMLFAGLGILIYTGLVYAEAPSSGFSSAFVAYPLDTVAVGFPPVMPTFAGRLSEEELHALIVYVKSLGGLVQSQRP